MWHLVTWKLKYWSWREVKACYNQRPGEAIDECGALFALETLELKGSWREVRFDTMWQDWSPCRGQGALGIGTPSAEVELPAFRRCQDGGVTTLSVVWS